MEYSAELRPVVDPASRAVSREEWLEARKALLSAEKELTRQARQSECGAACLALGEGGEGLPLPDPGG